MTCWLNSLPAFYLLMFPFLIPSSFAVLEMYSKLKEQLESKRYPPRRTLFYSYYNYPICTYCDRSVYNGNIQNNLQEFGRAVEVLKPRLTHRCPLSCIEVWRDYYINRTLIVSDVSLRPEGRRFHPSSWPGRIECGWDKFKNQHHCGAGGQGSKFLNCSSGAVSVGSSQVWKGVIVWSGHFWKKRENNWNTSFCCQF